MSDPVLANGPAAVHDVTSLAREMHGQILIAGATSVSGGAVDSRKLEPGDAFFALPGERTDGHRFVLDAAERGAGAIVVSRPPAPDELARLAVMGTGGPSVILVEDGLAALHQAAAAWRARFHPLVIGITGSLAKTSTKEQVAEVLSERWNVLRNPANENNEIGLPLTLLRLGPEHDVAVLEMGMYTPGDIAQLAALARPTIGIVTAVRGTHLERAGSIDAIERGKRELLEALPPTGTAILNADDPRVAGMATVLKPAVRVIRYGFDRDADVTATNVESHGLRGMSFQLRAMGGDADVHSPALGRHSVHNALAAVAAGLAAGLEMSEIVRGLARPLSLPHRTVLVDAGEWHLLDDTYNAAPDSMAAALDLLATLPGRRVAVLGEMLELGPTSVEAHRRVGIQAGGNADVLVAVGPMAAIYAEAAIAAGMAGSDVHEAADRATAVQVLAELLRPGDVVLVKASRGAELDLLVEELAALGRRERVG